ncbi:MAG: hypothetical protein ACLFU8_11635 [Anaerolineales bacterium]
MAEEFRGVALPRSERDLAMARRVIAARQILDRVQGNEELAGLLAEEGYDSATILEGLALQESAQIAINARQEALARVYISDEALEEDRERAVSRFKHFRARVTESFQDREAREDLGVFAEIPGDARTFYAVAHAAYENALRPEYQDALAAHGYPGESLRDELEIVEAYATAEESHEMAIQALQQADADRNAAVAALDRWMERFKKLAKVALRDRLDLQERLDL